METVQISSFKELSRRADVSEWQIRQLRRGKLSQMRLEPLLKLSHTLNISLPHLIQQFAEPTFIEQRLIQQNLNQENLGETVEHRGADQRGALVNPAPQTSEATLKQEYQRLQAQLVEQQAQLMTEFQQTALSQLETWMMQWPTAAYAAQANPQVPASRLVSLVRPVERLLEAWGVEAIAPIGAEVAYAPQVHQLMEGTAQPGDPVRVRYAGYRHHGKLLHRAKVSPV